MEATVVFLGLTDSAPENQGQSPSSTAQQVVLPMQPQGSVGGKGSSCRGEQTGVFTLNPFHLSQKQEGSQSQFHILSVLLPEKSVCKGVMLCS